MGNGRICIRSVSRGIGIGIGGLENFCGAQVQGTLLLELMEGCVSNSGNALSHSLLFKFLIMKAVRDTLTEIVRIALSPIILLLAVLVILFMFGIIFMR